MVAGDFDRWAEFYDSIYSDKNSEDVDFYVGLSKDFDRVLELGCGTGRIYLKLLEKGIDASGVDISESMVERLREKAAERGLEPDVLCGRMDGFEFGKSFDLIIIPFRSFLHNISVEE